MAQTQQAMSLVLSPSTASRLYAVPALKRRRRGGIPVTREMVSLFPAKLRAAIRVAMARGGVRVYLVDSDQGLTVEVRNIHRRA